MGSVPECRAHQEYYCRHRAPLLTRSCAEFEGWACWLGIARCSWMWATEERPSALLTRVQARVVLSVSNMLFCFLHRTEGQHPMQAQSWQHQPFYSLKSTNMIQSGEPCISVITGLTADCLTCCELPGQRQHAQCRLLNQRSPWEHSQHGTTSCRPSCNTGPPATTQSMQRIIQPSAASTRRT